ncbi:helix-turn-helix domain-containing protein [Myxococcota bacterium]|nr:helix-turn-helix domain-containing protein [Myxococcota bacterium]
MSESDQLFGERLRTLRIERGLSQAALAERSGLSTNAVGSLERGVRSPRVASAEALARALDVPIQALFNEPRTFAQPPAPAYVADPPEGTRGELERLLAGQPERVVRLVLDVTRRLVSEFSAAN